MIKCAHWVHTYTEMINAILNWRPNTRPKWKWKRIGGRWRCHQKGVAASEMIIGFWGAVYFVCRSKQPKRNNTKKNLFFFFFFLFCSRMLLLSQLDQNSQIEAPDNNSSSSIPNRSPLFFSFFCVCVCAPTISDVFLIFFLFEGIFFFRIFVAAQGVLFYWRRSISKRIIIISALARVIRESGFHSFLLGLFASSPIWFAALKRKNSRRFVTFSHPKELESNIMAATIFVNWVSCRLHIYLKLSLSTKWRI